MSLNELDLQYWTSGFNVHVKGPMISRRKLISSSFRLFGLKISSAVKSAQWSDVASFWDSWALETSQVDTILPAPMFRLHMRFSIPMSAKGLISDRRKTSAALLFVSVWSECCNNFDRQEDLHVWFCLTSMKQVLLSARNCMPTHWFWQKIDFVNW